MFKSGYVGVIGKTNAGKSTLVNLLVGQKVAIVSPKTQTTRNNILGILTKDNYQIVFVDTPGIHKSQNNLDKQMMKNVRSAVGSVDIILYIIDSTRKIDKAEIENIKKYAESSNVIVGVSKTDAVKKTDLIKLLCELGEIKEIKEIIPFSSKEEENIEIIINSILKLLPESKTRNFEFDDDLYTNNTVRFMTAEIIREKALYLLNEELPHGINIEITKFNESESFLQVDADLICEKESHKGIILGKNGGMIKEIGTLARKDIEELVGKKTMLKIFVKVDKNWRQSKNVVV